MDGKGLAQHPAVRQVSGRPSVDDQPKQTCRPESLRGRTSARGGFQFRLRAAKSGQASSAFPFDQCFERLSYQRRPFAQASERLRLCDEIIVECDGSSHDRHSLEDCTNLAPIGAGFNAYRSARRRLSRACASVPPARTAAATKAASAISSLEAPASQAWRVWVSMQ